MEQPKVLIGVINYNGKDVIASTMQGLRNLDYPDYEVIVVDNASTDGSWEIVQRDFPEAKIICMPRNQGAAAARNVIVDYRSSNYVLTLDNDIVLAPDALTILMQVMQQDPDIAACHPEIYDPDDPHVYHYNGGYNHYLCALVARDKPDPRKERPIYEVFPGIGAAGLLLNKRHLQDVGGFDEDYFFNMEDGDFTARLTLAGYKVVNVPGAKARHREKPRGTSKVFYQVRNRWYYILKLYAWRTILLSIPALLVYEFSQAVFLATRGAAKDYLRGTLAAIADIPCILRKRRQFQPLKRVRDQDWLRAGKIYMPDVLAKGRTVLSLKAVSDLVYGMYWRLIRPLC
jgi:GT2 family glycosyltransferase